MKMFPFFCFFLHLFPPATFRPRHFPPFSSGGKSSMTWSKLMEQNRGGFTCFSSIKLWRKSSNAPRRMEEMLHCAWSNCSSYRGGNTPGNVEEMLQVHGAKHGGNYIKKSITDACLVAVRALCGFLLRLGRRKSKGAGLRARVPIKSSAEHEWRSLGCA